jgi:hypothetical protein
MLSVIQIVPQLVRNSTLVHMLVDCVYCMHTTHFAALCILVLLRAVVIDASTLLIF